MKRALGFCAGGIVALMLAVCGYWYWINISPQITIPTPVMPQPNGYDYFIRAGAAFVPDENGVDETTDVHFVEGKSYPIAAKEAWLKQNAKALQLLREGLKYPVCQPPVYSFTTDYFEYRKFRSLTRAFIVQSHARAERGNWSGAVQSALDGYHFGNEVVRGGPFVGGLVGIALKAIGLHELNTLLPHTDVTTAKLTAFRLEQMYHQRWPLEKTLQDEKWQNISGTLEIMQSASWRTNQFRNMNIPLVARLTWLTISKRKLINDWEASSNVLIANAKLPYIQQQPIPAFSNPMVNALLPVFKRSRWNWARCDTLTLETMTMYALHAYKLNNGKYPASLKVLLPSYLKSVPVDPYDGIEPLHYKLQGNQYLLWSIGPDGIDNHGTPIINRDKRESMRYRLLDPDSKGDVVAGINVP